jgi:iron complex outermembrane recepter protein
MDRRAPGRTVILLYASGLLGTSVPDVGSTATVPLEEIVVIGVPISGDVPVARLPGNVYTLNTDSLNVPGTASVAESLGRRIASASSVDVFGNALQGGLILRGFTASPALGEPQGVVVYQGPMRANEAFGDVVQWDLLPVFSISNAQIITGSNPVYGLNSIGGAVALDMKDGFDATGLSAEAAVGSSGRQMATIEFGANHGEFGVYAGTSVVDDAGWRDHSPSRIERGYADLAWRSDTSEIGLGLTASRSELTGNGPAPTDLLAERREAVFTYPDRTNSTLAAAALRYSFRPRAAVTISGGAYYRHLDRSTANGDQADFDPCEEFVGVVAGFAPPGGALCFGAEIEGDTVEGVPTVVVGNDGVAVTGLSQHADAVFNRTGTVTTGAGASTQVAWRSESNDRPNILIAGAAIDVADTRYKGSADLGTLADDRGVDGLDVAIGNDEFNVGLRSRGVAYSVYASNTLSLAPDLHATGSLRWNRSVLEMRDQIGTDLDGDHHYSRVNPALGFTWNVAPWLTAYASYAENNRVPTPAELSCADPERACRFPNAFLADPPLDDVQARTVELGVRGQLAVELGSVEYSMAAFASRLRDDIIFISAGSIIGTGYFDNVDATRRRGLEVGSSGSWARLAWYATYALVDATFGSALTILSPHNPSADEDGQIQVRPGDRLPAVPRHSFRAGADFDITPELSIGAGLLGASGRYLRGDEANLQRQIDGYLRLDTAVRYRLGKVELFGRVENVFDAEYETFGIYGDATELGFADPRFLSPGAPRSVLVGIRARL